MIASGIHPKTDRPRSLAGRLAALAVACLAGASGTAAAEPAAAPLAAEVPLAAKVYLREPGVYRLTFEQLAEAGVVHEPQPSAGLGLSCGGQAVPIWVADGGDGALGPGDGIEFVGEHLAGDQSFFNPYSDLNVYRLRFDDPSPARMPAGKPLAGRAPSGAPRFERRLHLEKDEMLLRFSKGERDDLDLWFWAKLGWADRQPFSLPLELPGRDPASTQPVHLRVGLRGWSWQRPDDRILPDHRVEISWNGVALGRGEWDAQGEMVVDLPSLPAEALATEPYNLTLSVPPRISPATAEKTATPATAPARADEPESDLTGADSAGAEAPPPSTKDPIVDVVVLNWVEVSYPALPLARPQAERLYVEPPASPGAADSRTAVFQSTAPVVVYGESGSRLEARPAGPLRADGTRPYAVGLGARESWVYAVAGGQLLTPVAVAPDRPSDLRSAERQADYVMVTHPTLRQAIEPLAAFHRGRGLTVEVVDIEDVYDEFSSGVVTPRALRDFLSHAYHHWAKPAPRFVLLVGDASWDPRSAEGGEDRDYVDWAFAPRDGARFRKNRSTSYAEEGLRTNRNLIPTGTYFTAQGHAASDNEFVAVDGNDRFPDMAIGRLPVVTPEEVSAIVAKTIRYMQEPEPGPWRQRILWITNEDPALQRHSDRMAATLAERGFESRKVYPGTGEDSNSMLQETLRRSFDEGFALVHFHGHGGRYIWRTGVADFEKNSDLFTLEDLDRLTPSGRLAVVLSMTCYSAPFDHPTADSIGEKLLRLPDKGAVAVFAASWRNSPLTGFSEAMVREVLGEKTVGEAMVKAKRRAVTLTLIEQYNLLGDPAVEMPARAETAAPAVRASVP